MADKKVAKQRATEQVSKNPLNRVVTLGETGVQGFLEFLRTQGVIGLAVGLILGTALGVVVKSFVDNVVMPPVGLLLGSANGLKGLSWTIGTTGNGTPAVLNYGTFLNDVVNFLIIALVVYIVFNLLGLTKLDKKKD